MSMVSSDSSPSLRSNLTDGTDPKPCALATEPCRRNGKAGNSTLH